MADSKHHALLRPQLMAALLALIITVPSIGAHAGMVKVKVGDSRGQALDVYGQRHGLSPKAAGRWIRAQERANDVRIIDEFGLPEGTQLDYYKVGNHEDPAKRVEFQGRGTLVSAYSYLGSHYKEILFGLLNTKERDDAIKLLRQARDHGFMVVPAAFGGKGGPVGTAAAQTVTVIVIIPEFPHWNDPCPVTDGDTDRFDTDVYYQTGDDYELMRAYPMDSNNHGWEEEVPHWYADSPGGRMSGGIVLGLSDNGAWTGNETQTSNNDHPRAGGEEWKPEFTLQTDWFNLVFNKGYTNSLTNYYYQNSHGHISIEGDYSNIIGWVHDHHVLDRMAYPYGIFYAVQPGSPVLRPQDPAGPGIVRASLHGDGLTFFFRQNVYGLSTGNMALEAWQEDVVAGADPAVDDWVTISIGGHSTMVSDPWDGRRWTVLNDSWEWTQSGADPDTNDFTLLDGMPWRVTCDPPGAIPSELWQSGSTGYRSQGHGCTNLSDTLFTTDDVLPSANGNRLLSFCYYVHDHEFSASSNAYQLETCMQGSYTDPIAGSSEGTHQDRPWPFDHDAYDHNFPNAGNIFGNGTPGHSAGNMRTDVYQTLVDRGITYTGYDRIMFIFPAAEQSEGDPNASIIPHASGHTITVPEGAGLGLLAHELGHTFGTVDLYDKNFYDNIGAFSGGVPPVPFFFECPAGGPYSVMAHGIRMDPWHKLGAMSWGPWADETPVVEDLGFTQIWQVETTLRDPVILKLPANPLSVYASKNPLAPAGYPGAQAQWDALANPDGWSEYFLIENRNVTGGSYFGDASPVGMYIWHIDERNIGGEQRAEETMSVIIEQADGLHELETNGSRSPGGGFSASPGDLSGDPFPGSQGNRYFRERPQTLGNGADSPTSWSHGAPDAGGMTVRPGTPTDSFVRVTDIGDPGDPMTAYIYVEPAEIVATATNLVPAANTGPYYEPGDLYYKVQQGHEDFPFMLLNLDNDDTYPNLSTNDVTVRNIAVYEVGTSLVDSNLDAAKLYEDDGDGVLDPAVDRLLKTTTLSGDYATFSNLNYTVPLGEDRDLIVAYDVARDATVVPTITLGAELTQYTFIEPAAPGAVQQRERRDGSGAAGPGYDFGDSWFPLTSSTVQVIEAPDELTVTGNSVAPETAEVGEQDVPMLQLGFTVDNDEVRLEDMTITQTDPLDPAAGRDAAEGGTDMDVVRAYDDANANGAIDGGEALLGEGTMVHSAGVSNAFIQFTTPGGFPVTHGSPKYVIVAVNVAQTATVGRGMQFEATDAASFTLQVNPGDGETIVGDFPLRSGVCEIVGKQPPTLSPPGDDPAQALAPTVGDFSTSFVFRAIYTNIYDEAPQNPIYVEVMDELGGTNDFAMIEADGGDVDYTDGKEYTITLPGFQIGWGANQFRFKTDFDGAEICWPETGHQPGPVIAEASTTLVTQADGETEQTDPYEEGDTIYVRVEDADENVDPTAAETVDVTLTVGTGGDSETLTLTETGNDTGVFTGNIPMDGNPTETVGDGTLSVVAGAAAVPANTVTATYTDKDPSPADASNDSADVVDTVAPDPAQDDLGAVSGTDGGSIDLDWSTYDETLPAQIDLVGYEVYVETATFADADIPALTPRVTVMAGTKVFTVTGLTYDTDYWVAVVPIDEVPNRATLGATGNALGPIHTNDTDAPTLANLNPADTATAVGLDTNIEFDVLDPGSGVDVSTMAMQVNGAPVTPTTTGSDGDTTVHFTYDPPADFDWNDVVTVDVTVADMGANSYSGSWSFSILTDTTGPVITTQDPAPGATDVAATQDLTFHIEDQVGGGDDAASGIDTASIAVTVDDGSGAVDVTGDCVINDADPTDVIVTYTPTGGWPWGTTAAPTQVDISVTAADNAGNGLVPDPTAWSFETALDDEPPTISNLSPAAGAADVPQDTTIRFRLMDAKSGVDDASLQVYLNGGLVDAGDLTITGTAASYDVSFTPPTFGYGEVVSVRVVVEDFVSNLIDDEDPLINGPGDGYEWEFTTGPAPRYRITGTVTDQDAGALVAVTMTVYEGDVVPPAGVVVDTVTTDGNGSYVVTDLLAGAYTVAPTLDEYDFTPTREVVTITTADVTEVDFVGTLRTYTVSGVVTEDAVGKAGVTVSDGTRSAVTNVNGEYTLTDVPNGLYTITPALAFYDFAPTSTSVVVDGADVADVDFEAIAQTFSVSGTVRDYDGDRIQGVRVKATLGADTETAITNEAGQYNLSGLVAGTWSLDASKVGYAITPATQDVTIPPDTTGADFVAYLSFPNSFAPGISFIGVPCYPADEDPTVVFGTGSLARWDPTATPPEYALPGAGAVPGVLEVRPGRGFFVNLVDGDIEVPGRPVSTTQPFTLTLGPVWNMMANMFPAALPFGNIIPGVPNAIRSYGYVYDAGRGTYLLIAADPGVNVARTHIQPWEGIWLRTAGASATAAVTPPVGPAAAAADAQSIDLGEGGWTIPIVASSGSRQDTLTAVGVGPSMSQGLQLENPPMAPHTVDVYVESTDGRYLAQDIRTGATASTSWDLVVCTDLADADIDLALPDLSQVPEDLVVYLTDVEVGKRMYARTMTKYTFAGGEAGAKRRFTLEVAPKSDAGLVISSAAAARTGRGVVVSYSVSKPCEVGMTVTNIAGRVVRVLAEGATASKGLNTVAWDARGAHGTPVPNGRYLIRIEVRSEDGQRVQAIAPAMIQR